MRDELCSLCDNLTVCHPPQQLQDKTCLLLMVNNPCPIPEGVWVRVEELDEPRGPECPRCNQSPLAIEGLRLLSLDLTEGGIGVRREVSVFCPSCKVRNSRAYSEKEDPHLVFRAVGDVGGD